MRLNKNAIKIILNFISIPKVLPILIAFVVILPSAMRAENKPIQVAIDTNKRVVGDKITVTIKAHFPKNKLVFSTPADLSSHRLEMLDTIATDTLKKGEEWEYQQKYFVSAYDSGTYYFPSLQFIVANKGDTTKRYYYTDSLPIYISLVKADTSLPAKPIKSPLSVPYTFKEFWPLLAWILGGLALILGIIYLVRWLNKDKTELKIPLKPPFEEAILALDNLQKKRLWESGQEKEFYIALTDILRRYITRIWNMDAFEMTSSEIIKALKKESIDPKNRKDLKEVLELADLVKFAKHSSVPDENIRVLESSRMFLINTRPIETEEDEKISGK